MNMKSPVIMMWLVLSLAACAKQTPESVFLDYVEKLQSGDIDGAAALIIEASEPRRKDKLQRELKYVSEQMQNGKLEIVFYEAQRKAPWALIVYGMTLVGAEKNDVRIKEEFVFYNGKRWLIVPQGIRSDARVEPLFRSAQTEALFSDFRSNMQRYQRQYQGSVAD